MTTQMLSISKVSLVLALLGPPVVAQEVRRPNVLWIIAEDLGQELGCHGAKEVWTPNLDALARNGVRYTKAFTVTPVCSTSRSSFMTGVYATSIGMPERPFLRLSRYKERQYPVIGMMRELAAESRRACSPPCVHPRSSTISRRTPTRSTTSPAGLPSPGNPRLLGASDETEALTPSAQLQVPLPRA